MEIKIGVVLYADDTATWSLTCLDCKKILTLIETFCKDSEIMINVKKTFWMKVGEPFIRDKDTNIPIVKLANADENFMLNGQPIEKINFAKYLCFWIQSNDSNKLHLWKRKAAAMASTAKLNKLGLNELNMDLKVKGQIYHTFFRSSLL